MSNISCPKCAQINEHDRDVCWACCQLLIEKEGTAVRPAVPAKPSLTETIRIVIDGKEYARLEDVPERLRALLKDKFCGGIPDILQRAAEAKKSGRRTRIVVNGKEYERLDDVPEEFRSALKGAVARASPQIAEFAQQAKKISSLRPSISLSWSPPREALRLDPNLPVAIPDGFQLGDDGRERRISWRWISWGTLGATLFIFLWDGVLAFCLQAFCSSKGARTDVPLWVSAGIAALIAGGILMAYAAAAYLVNRTSVRIRTGQVSVRHGPLPWLGAKDISRLDIARVWSEKVGRATDEDTAFDPSVTYAVRLLLKGGQELNLLTGLLAPEQALFIEQEIRKSL